MAATSLIGIGEMRMSSDPAEVPVAPNLGSCLGVAVYDGARKSGGMIHCLLPSSMSDPGRAKLQPCLYVDTGVATLLGELLRAGSQKRDLVVRVAGGSAINDTNGTFEIGKKNFTVLRKLLWKNNLLLKSHDVGGAYSRTVSLHIATGEVWLKAQGQLIQLD